jgi:DNA-binding beta-propeller fold protein YncE
VNEYDLSTAWDVSTASFLQNFSVSSQEGAPIGIFFKPDGTKMYIAGAVGDDVNEYGLSTAWDISTASYNQNFSVAAQDTTPTGVSFKPDGTKMYIVGVIGDAVSEYDIGSSSVATLTWPSSIEWAGGVAPAAPANGETDVFTFTTDDSGTTYTGVKSIDNAS